MFFKKPKWRQFFSSFLVFALVLTLLPGSAFALTTGDNVRISVVHVYVDENGDYTEEISSADEKKLEDTFTNSTRLTEDQINTYVYSSEDMPQDDQDGSVVPYFLDEAQRKWELYKILVANGRKIDDPGDQYVLMDQKAIASANSVDDYVVDTTEISLEPFASSKSSYYFIWYAWKLAEDEPEEVTSYQVSYNLNVPSGTTTVYPVVDYGNDGLRMDIADGDGNRTQVISDLNQLNGSFYAVNPYTVSDFSSFNSGYGYADFLAFDIYNHNNYYDFVGWKANDGDKLYDIGEKIDDISKLADETGKITFTAQWKPIKLLTDEELADAAQTISLDGFVSSDEIDKDVLIVQSVGETMDNTDENVFLPKDEIIQYLVSANVNSALTQVPDSGGMTFQSSFAEFTYQVSIDSKLEFANVGQDGKVTIVFDASPDKPYEFAPVVLNSTNSTNITGAQVTKISEGIYSITFAPDNVPTNSDGSMYIEITLQWNDKNVGRTDTSADLSIRGLDFKIKSDATWTVNDTVQTSANIVGQFSMRNKVMQPRAYYMTASAQLTSSWEGWKEQFNADTPGSYPIAFVHAVQFMDYELAAIDLSADTSATLEANTVIATYPGTVTVTPADITIYMGGDGGYDAVVGEGGTTTSNSLPHPLFKIEAPEGIDPEDLTFTNADKTWTVISDGNGYYHFSEGQGQDKVRVTYSYTDESGKTHTVTSDAFDPTEVGDIYTTYTIALYPGENDMSQVRAKTDNGVYYVDAETGTLTVRAVADKKPTSAIQEAVPSTPVQNNAAVAVEPEGGTSYTLNNLGVPLPDDAQPSLLFDSIIEDDETSTERTDALKKQVDTVLGETEENVTRNYEIKYLDLVDANNGNAWITSSNGTDIYWGYPEGTDQNTEFTLLHFKGLHRDGENSGFDVGDIVDIIPEEIDIEKTETGIKFHVSAGGFSPFALVYDTKEEEPVPETVTVTFDSGKHGDFGWPHVTSKDVELTKGGSLTEAQIPYVFEDEGYEFIGWYKQGSASWKLYSDEDLLKMTFDSDATFIAQYKYVGGPSVDDEYDVVYNANFTDGGVPRRQGYDKGETVTVSENKWFERDGYVFVGWNTEADGTGDSYDPDDTFKMPGRDVYLYAQWQKEKPGPDDTGVSRWLETEDHNAYLTGYPDSTFGADRNMTRAEVAQMFYSLLKNKNVMITTSFSDVSNDAWYATAVKTMASLGMMSGYPDGTFRPDEPITRAEFATVTLAFAYEPDNARCSYLDVSTSAWYYTYVAQATTYGWIGGYPDGTFRPNNSITRVEVCVIVNNMLGRTPDEDYIDRNEDELVNFVDLSDRYWGYYTIMEATNGHEYTGNYSNETWTDMD